MEQFKRNIGRRFFFLAMLLVYLAILSYGLFFAESMDRTVVHGTFNNVPFQEIGRVIHYADTLGWRFVAVNLGGNVLAFLPFGFLVSAIWSEENHMHPLGLIVLAILFSASVENLQYLTSVGVADVDDVILNTFGAFIGYEMDILGRNVLMANKYSEADGVVLENKV